MISSVDSLADLESDSEVCGDSSEMVSGNLSGMRTFFSAAALAAAGVLTTGCVSDEKITSEREWVDSVACTPYGKMAEMRTEMRTSGPNLWVKYQFDDFETPISAAAYIGDKVLAKVRKEDGDEYKGMNGVPPADSEHFYFTVAETDFALDGTQTYEGRMLYLAPKMGAGVRDLGRGLSTRVREERISGKKRADLWPRWTNINVPDVACPGGI
jgi:hypothetical protein